MGREPANLPRILIVGRPNVGKSTLFNRLTRRRRAIVHPRPGVTRDYLVGRAEHDGLRFELVDTGGMGEPIPGDPFVEKVWAMTESLLEGADLILFMVSCRDGLTAADEILARRLHKTGKPVLLLANKADSRAEEPAAEEFRRLGFPDMVPVSAEHARNLEALLERIRHHVRGEGEAEAPAENPVCVAILGRPNVGKSSLLNRLLMEERSIVSDLPGTTRDAVDTDVTRGGGRFRFVDTAGMRRRARTTEHLDKLSFLRAREALARADVALLVLDPSRELAHQDQAIGRLVVEAGVACVIVINKWDMVALPKAEQEEMMEFFRKKFHFLDFAPVLRVSALEGTGVEGLWPLISRAAEARRLRVPTARLNRDVQEIVAQNPPPVKGKQAFRVLYVTQAETVPPAFVIFAGKAEALSPAYLKYMERELRKRHPLEGTPVILRLRARKAGKGRGKRN